MQYPHSNIFLVTKIRIFLKLFTVTRDEENRTFLLISAVRIQNIFIFWTLLYF